jgi:CheY-like chemotaxis protein
VGAQARGGGCDHGGVGGGSAAGAGRLALPPERGGRIPAVALTAHSLVQDRLQSLRAGFQTHVPKPLVPEELVEVVASLGYRT